MKCVLGIFSIVLQSSIVYYSVYTSAILALPFSTNPSTDDNAADDDDDADVLLLLLLQQNFLVSIL